MARKRRDVSWPLDLSTFRWKRPPPSEGQKGGGLTAHLVVLPKRLHHPVHRRTLAVLHLHPVLRPPGLIVEVVTRNDHATIAAQDCLSATTASVSDIDGLTILKAWVSALR